MLCTTPAPSNAKANAQVVLRPAHNARDARDQAENGEASKASRKYEKCSISLFLPLGRSIHTPQYKAGATRSEKASSRRAVEGLTAYPIITNRRLINMLDSAGNAIAFKNRETEMGVSLKLNH